MALQFEIGCGAWALGWIAFNALEYRIPCERLVVWLILGAWALICVGASIAGCASLALAFALTVGIGAGILSSTGAVAVLLGGLLIRPWEMPGVPAGYASIPRLLAALALIRVAVDGVRAIAAPDRATIGIHRGSETILFFALFSWFFISVGLTSGSDGLARLDVAGLMPLGVMMILVPGVCGDARSLQLLRTGVVVAVIGAVSAALWHEPVVGKDMVEEGARLSGSGLFGNSNDLAALISIALPLMVVPALRQRSVSVGLGAALGGSILLCGLWLTQSRGAVIAVALGGVMALFSLGRRRFILPVGALVVGGMVALFFGSVSRNAADLEGSQASRWNYVIAGVRMARSSPLAGVGMGNYPRMYERFTPAFDEWGERTAHSSWVLALAEGGFPGFGLFVLFMFAVVRRAWSIRCKAPEWLVAVLTYGVAMSFLSHTYSLLPYLTAALVIGASRIHTPVKSQLPKTRTASQRRRTPPWRRGGMRIEDLSPAGAHDGLTTELGLIDER